jgi:hypothetical protein
MNRPRVTDARIVGAVLVLLGAVALVEGRRLYTLRTRQVAGAVVGDDTFPIIVGAALIMLGAYLWFGTTLPRARVELPQGRIRSQMLAGAGLLFLYWLVVPWLGYAAGTGLVSIALFRAMGGYRWPAALLLGAVTTGALHLLFRVWLHQPLPTGLLGA